MSGNVYEVDYVSAYPKAAEEAKRYAIVFMNKRRSQERYAHLREARREALKLAGQRGIGGLLEEHMPSFIIHVKTGERFRVYKP